MVNLGNDWDEILKDEFQKDYYRNLRKFLADEYRKCVVYPNMYDIFNALRYTSFENTRAVILGQDPYHGPHQAHGLCFSVLKGIAPPPSLKNIFRELSDDVGFVPPHHGELHHIPPNAQQIAVRSPASRRAYRVGKAGRADVEFGSHGARTSAEQPQGNGLGDFYGQGNFRA